jgi:serine protease Do
LLDGSSAPGPVDFEEAAKSATPAVVHITTVIGKSQANNNNIPRRRNPFADLFGEDFFGEMFPQGPVTPQRASGSGVIISEDGYIITNNHVIESADEIKVTLSNKKYYTAKVIGRDPSSDLAVLKIEEKALPFILYGNSDNVRVGQWVLAIGYPLNLETTVTAGIVSAKARTLNLNGRKSNTPIESFIQTDAAVNQGNSGGALVNTVGELIGINSAIASPTGAYAGYSYAIPVNIVKKIVNDIIQYGEVQRAYLGIQYAAEGRYTEEQLKELGIKEGEGVYVLEAANDGAAAAAGLKKGDIITKLDQHSITTPAELQEHLAKYKPGDKINVSYKRGGSLKTTQVTLKNAAGTYSVVKNTALDALGADFVTLDSKKASELGIKGGVVVRKIREGLIDDQTRMRDGFVILRANGKDIRSVEEMNTVISQSNGNLLLQGFYPGYEGLYDYTISIE